MYAAAALSDTRVWLPAALLVALGGLLYRESTRRPPVPQVVISELMAINTDTLTDEDGDASDWIELTNQGPRPADLTGFGLTDDRRLPKKWTLPSLRLGPG